MITSKITGKGQVTIPKSIRETLHVEKGDYISYEVTDDKITIKKIPKADLEWARAVTGTLSEWEDELDDERDKQRTADSFACVFAGFV